MNDYYTECLVKRKLTTAATLLPFAAAALAVASAFSFFLIGIFGVAIFLLFCLLTKYLFGIRNIEFEYLLADKQFSIDTIYNQKRRKKTENYSIEEMLVIAPELSERVREYDRQVKKTVDFSSGEVGRDRFVIICQRKGLCEKVIIEPDDRMKNSLKMAAPRIFVTI